MDRLVSSREAREIDQRAQTEFGIPGELLMEEAGIRMLAVLVDRVSRVSDPSRLPKVAFLVGKGNNGGDAMVMARHAFVQGLMEVIVVLFAEPKTNSAQIQVNILRKMGVGVEDAGNEKTWKSLSECSFWVDGLLGVGLEGKVEGPLSTPLQRLVQIQKELGIRVAAVDVPSGMGDKWFPEQDILRCDWTLAAGWVKDFCYRPFQRPFCGELVRIPLSFPENPEIPRESIGLLTSEDLKTLLPETRPEDYKNRRGHVVVVGGSAGMTGAAVLATRSAASAGAGLLTLAADSESKDFLAAQFAFVQTLEFEQFLTRSNSDRYDAFVVGPGWGRGEQRVAALDAILQLKKPTVIDADGLFALKAWIESNKAFSFDFPVVLTPHPGEMAMLAGGEKKDDLLEHAKSFAQRTGAVVVLKGSVTWIVAGERRTVWDGQNPALGCAGSGDCLAGALGAFLGRGLDPFRAAQAAVVLHGMSGTALAREEGWFTADQIPAAMARISFGTCAKAASAL